MPIIAGINSASMLSIVATMYVAPQQGQDETTSGDDGTERRMSVRVHDGGAAGLGGALCVLHGGP